MANNPFGRFSLPNLLGRYSLPAVMGRLFHHDTPTSYPITHVDPLTQPTIHGYGPDLDGYGSAPPNQLAGGYSPDQLPISHVPLNGAGGDFGSIQGIGAPRIGGSPSGYQSGGSPTLGAQGTVDPSQWGQLVSMAYDTRNRIGDTNSTLRRG